MKKLLQSFIIITSFELFLLIGTVNVYAQGALNFYTCGLQSVFWGPCQVGPVITCDASKNYYAIGADGRACSSLSASECTWGTRSCHQPASVINLQNVTGQPANIQPNTPSQQTSGSGKQLPQNTSGQTQIGQPITLPNQVGAVPGQTQTGQPQNIGGGPGTKTSEQTTQTLGSQQYTSGKQAGNQVAVIDPTVHLNQIIDNQGFKFNSHSTIGDILNGLLPILFAIAGTALLLYLIFGGFGYLTSGGDPKKMESAKTVITNAVIGFIIIISAFFITQVVNYIFSLGSSF